MKKTPDPVRIGVLGCGMISQAAHFGSCQRARNARLYAICDAADDLRSRMAQIWEPEAAYGQYEEMLADRQLWDLFHAVQPVLRRPRNSSRKRVIRPGSAHNRRCSFS